MAEFKNMTVQALRELARKALGRGHAKLKTKAELIEALQAAERKVASVANRAATSVKEATGKAARATEKVVESVRRGRERRTQERERRTKEKEDRKRTRAGAAGPEKPRARPGAAGAKAQGAPAARRREREEPKEAVRKGQAPTRPAEEPDPDGYMVARVAGEEALRGAPHPMTEGAVEEKRGGRAAPARSAQPESAFDERLGDLPFSYADDALTALARDPRTLFLYWDHAQETLRQAWEGLDGGRPQLWVFSREPDGGWTRIRTLEIALESRSYYVHDLDPGRLYRAEIHVVDRRGRDKLLPRVSNEMMLPPLGPSPIIDDRFMRLPWGEPLQRVLREAHAGGPFPEEIRAQLARLSDWSRFAGRVWGGSAGGMGGRPFSPTSSPSSSSPSLPWSRDGQPDGEER